MTNQCDKAGCHYYGREKWAECDCMKRQPSSKECDALIALKYDTCEYVEKCEPCRGVRQMAIDEIERLRPFEKMHKEATRVLGDDEVLQYVTSGNAIPVTRCTVSADLIRQLVGTRRAAVDTIPMSSVERKLTPGESGDGDVHPRALQSDTSGTELSPPRATVPPVALRPGLERAIDIVSKHETPSEYYDPYRDRLIELLDEAIGASETKVISP